jgi:FKBP-type peptidyl-prolyl cis-trans isomerase FklB
MITVKRTNSVAAMVSLFLFLSIFSLSGVGQSSQATASAVADIQLSYKRDPRQVDPYRGIGPWVSGPGYAGATAQDTVETVARAVNGTGQPVTASLEWVPSDPEMVTVSPSQGDHVKITVHKPGESRLKITAQGISKELVVKATSTGKFLVFQIAPPAPAKTNGSAPRAINPALKTKDEQLSYAVGMRLAKTLQKQSIKVEPDLVKQGINDALSGGQGLMSEDQAHALLIGVQTELSITEAALQRKAFADKNKKEGEEFLAQNKNKDGVVSLPSGLQYRVIKAGDGKKPQASDVAVCHYRATLLDGTEFDNSHKHKGGLPASLPLRGVIRGWQEALTLMPAGSKWQLFVPPDLAYGERGVPRVNIGPNATLIFEVELLSVKEPDKQAPPVTASTTLTPEQLDAVEKAMQAAKKESDKETEREKNQ